MPFDDDIKLERTFERQIKTRLGQYFICRDIEADLKAATDFAIFRIRPFAVGVRLRRFEYYQKWPNQFTIRWSRPSGVDTEIHKIRKGFVEYILYGFLDKCEQRIINYFIGDLKIFRRNEPEPITIRPNRNGDSTLAAYERKQFSDAFILYQDDECDRRKCPTSV